MAVAFGYRVDFAVEPRAALLLSFLLQRPRSPYSQACTTDSLRIAICWQPVQAK
jgi:hypothetical protein